MLANRNSAITVTSAGANTIGGIGAEGNLVAGHYIGIAVTSSTGIALQGNTLGTDKTNSAALANYYGIYISDSSQILVGSAATGTGNVLAANEAGLTIGSSTQVTVEGNIIGLSANGSRDLARGYFGVRIVGNSQVALGTAAAGNIISGSHVYQVYVGSNLPGGIRIQGNLIGTNALAASKDIPRRSFNRSLW